jgi:hypothetical protein
VTEPWVLTPTALLDEGLHWMLKRPHCIKLAWTSPPDLDLAALALGVEEMLTWMLYLPDWVEPPWRAALAFEFEAGRRLPTGHHSEGTGNLSSGSLVLLLEPKCLRRRQNDSKYVLLLTASQHWSKILWQGVCPTRWVAGC